MLERIPRLPSERTRRLKVALAHYLTGGDDVPDFTVAKRGTDSSGRAIYATAYMWDWWNAVCSELGFRPTITQGAFMVRNGGGAQASAGYHDAGGTFDLRVWDLTKSQVDQTIRTLRASGAAAWLRNQQHGGFDDPHIHLVFGSDAPLAPGAAWQWLAYLNGGDGLSGGGRDYHPRPAPLVTEPPADLMEDEMKPEDWTRLSDLIDERLAAHTVDVGKKNEWSLDRFAKTMLEKVNTLVEKVNALSADVKALKAKR